MKMLIRMLLKEIFFIVKVAGKSRAVNCIARVDIIHDDESSMKVCSFEGC